MKKLITKNHTLNLSKRHAVAMLTLAAIVCLMFSAPTEAQATITCSSSGNCGNQQHWLDLEQ
ncbi:MAG TPA: hypothetical protein VHS34_13185 [Terriglobales bacterium]|nr:hypothetical protein [Terriglobales bacterium]